MKQEKEIIEEESYFNNKILRFLFNSKENVPQGIFIVNMVIYSFVSIIFVIVLGMMGGFEPTIVDKLFFDSVEGYNFTEALIIFFMLVITMIISMIEVDLFHKYIEK